MRQWQVKFLVIFASLIIGLVLTEVGLRILGIEYPNFYDFDPHLGHALRPGTQGYWLKEGKGYVSINRDGLRDREHDIKKPSNTLRIAVLGDSYAEAMHVNREDAFWAIMEKQLQGCKNLQRRNIEVINFGISGFGSTQELLMLRHKVWKYSPDIVLLAFCTGNDVSDNSFALKQRYSDPYFILENDELILHDQSSRKRWEEKVANNHFTRPIYQWLIQFRVMQVVERGKEVIRDWWSRKKAVARSDASGFNLEPGILNPVYHEPTDEVWKEAWKVTEGVLLKMRDEVDRKGARFVVVVLSNSNQVHPDVAARAGFAKILGVNSLFYPDRRVEKFCESHDIPVLLLAPLFQDYATKHQVFLHGFEKTLGDGHWNQHGHQLAGQTIAEWLCHQLH
jgi:hypothetical protein